MAEPIRDTTAVPSLLTQLLGQQTSNNTTAQQLAQALTQGVNSGTTSSTSTSSANIEPLLQAFAQGSAGMTPEALKTLITSIFTEGAQAVPALTQQFANSTGSRVSGNSGLNLALGDLNKSLSSQVVDRLLQFNQAGQANATNAANAIAGATRQTNQTGQTANQTQQSQTNQTNSTQQQKQQQGVNPLKAGVTALGGTALNWLDKKGAFDKLFGRTGTPAAGGVGTISGSTGSLQPNAGGPMLTNGGGGAGTLSAPAASQGFLAGPVAANPYGFTPGGAADLGLGAAPSYDFSGGITGLGGFTGGSGLLGSAADLGFGSLPTDFNAFGTLGTESLGSNLDFGANPYGYVPDGSGIMADAGGGWGGAFTQGISGASDWLGGALGGAADWIGSLFANGGIVQPNLGYADGGEVGAKDNARELRTMMSRRNANLATAPAYGFEGMNIGQIIDATQRDRGLQSGIESTLNPTMFQQFLQMLMGPPTLPGIGGGYADGGQVETGGTTRVRNQNYLGPQMQRGRGEAMNYSGYAPSGGGVGASQPAGGSPSMQAITSPMMVTPGTTAVSVSAGDAAAQARAQYAASIDAANRMAMAMQGQTGGSGGVGEGGAPGQNEADNGAAGIGPSGIAAAPTGTSQAVATGLGMAGMPAPGLSSVLGLIAAIAAAVNNASSNAAVDAAIGVATAEGQEGAVDSGDDAGGGGGNGGVGSGVGSGGATGGSTSGDGGNGGGNYKDGGLVRGPGTGTSDSIKVKSRQAGGKDIKYSDGEYVIPADVVAALGVQHFDNILDAFHVPSSQQ